MQAKPNNAAHAIEYLFMDFRPSVLKLFEPALMRAGFLNSDLTKPV